MARVNNPELGEILCKDCDEMATVHQTARGAGRYLYTRCANCGPDQRTGAKVQTRLWFTTQWKGGEPDIKPPNVEDSNKKEPESEPENADFEPENESDENGGEPSKTGAWPWVAGGFGLLALIIKGAR
ncbi:MAG: hypothetical protein KBT88_03535 [Gammaproteobacteria bacterium]|nr:hypothetical protein [Gammaproteobacteria bacterium]MBQ0838833.1 hypothetical protein [Gammaproteobacteria bacterium]